MTTIILFAAIVYLGMLTQATLGFGSNVLIVTLTLAAHLYQVQEILPVVVPVNIVISGYITWRYRHQINREFLLKRMLPLMALGLPIGYLLFLRGSDVTLKVAFGGLVVLLAAIELYRHFKPDQQAEGPQPLPKPVAVGFLFGAGIIHGLFACGGPMAVYVTSREITEKGEFRATMTTLWVILNTAMTVLYIVGGKVTPHSAQLAALMLIPTGLGLISGIWAHDRLPKRTFRLLVYLLLLGAGASLLFAG